jgi:hypothetical protein
MESKKSLRKSQDLAKYSLKSSIIEKLKRKGVLDEDWIKNETQGSRAREAAHEPGV